ncbi:hypothetical protein F5B21DRAFT_519334 [Xylaria acuta]|nr:hypothetical protein F5B21DRAFT_519334 [Xylaria acuta]
MHVVNNDGDTFLMRLGSLGLPPSMAQLLVEAGCPLNARNSKGETALHHIASMSIVSDGDRNRAAVYNYLVKVGADRTTTDNRGLTAEDILREYGTAVDRSGRWIVNDLDDHDLDM